MCIFEVNKPYGPLTVGDLLRFNDETDCFESSKEFSTNDGAWFSSSFSSVSLGSDFAEFLAKHGFLKLIDDVNDVDDGKSTSSSTVETKCCDKADTDECCCKYGVKPALELIDRLTNEYSTKLADIVAKAERGELQPCVRVEAETVYYNLNKVLTEIKKVLTGSNE